MLIELKFLSNNWHLYAISGMFLNCMEKRGIKTQLKTSLLTFRQLIPYQKCMN